jgi:hypothetical protein
VTQFRKSSRSGNGGNCVEVAKVGVSWQIQQHASA